MHDANGTLLKIGDTVLIPATITDLSPQDDYCNVTAKSLLGRKPDGLNETISGINTAVMILWDRPEEAEESNPATEATSTGSHK